MIAVISDSSKSRSPGLPTGHPTYLNNNIITINNNPCEELSLLIFSLGSLQHLFKICQRLTVSLHYYTIIYYVRKNHTFNITNYNLQKWFALILALYKTLTLTLTLNQR